MNNGLADQRKLYIYNTIRAKFEKRRSLYILVLQKTNRLSNVHISEVDNYDNDVTIAHAICLLSG